MIAAHLPVLQSLFPNIDDWGELGQACIDTLLMLSGSLLLTVVIGLPLGVLLFLTGKGQLHAMPKLYGVLSLVVNVLRSIPFIILMIVLMPLTYVLVGTKLGIRGAIPPLVIGAGPFFARALPPGRSFAMCCCRKPGPACGPALRSPPLR
jgi:D-methionine transport system permease protein